MEELQYVEVNPVMGIKNWQRARIENVKVVNDGIELTFRVQDYQTYQEANQLLASR